jgi:hypothetical protein
MANTFFKIASVTVGSGGAASIDFTSIPGTYTDLLVKVSGRTAAALGFTRLYFNGSTSSFSSIILFATGSSAGSASYASDIRSGYINGTDSTSSTFSNNEIYIPNYASSNNKSVSIDSVTENNGTAAYSLFSAGLWANTSAITSVKIDVNNNNDGVASTFSQYTTATLYGIKKD